MIKFILNNKLIKTSVNAGVPLLDFIRDNRQLKGSKIGCQEGDCGACTVLVGRVDGEEDVSYESITSCISPLGNANGKHIVTIEGINLPKQLNQVQQAMADHYATQCGFCTPGFVMSMTGFAITSNPENIQTCNDAISGNICRCTGYKAIERAGNVIEEKLKEKQDQSAMAWLIKEGFIPAYFDNIPQRLIALQKDLISPQNEVGAKIANGTDVYVHNADKMAESPIYLLGTTSELDGISFEKGICTMGANTTATAILEHEILQSNFPKLRAFMKLVSSEPIRNMGTIGGNFVNASPIGDMSIFFLALNSTLTILHENGTERRIPFQNFHQNYKVFDLSKEEIVKSISFKMLTEDEYYNFEKVCKRTHLDIASVNAAGKLLVKENRIEEAHFSVGGTAAVPKYLFETNAFLKGQSIEPSIILEAEKIMQSEISPISDVRGSADYKRLLARQLFYAHFIELFPTMIQLDKLVTT